MQQVGGGAAGVTLLFLAFCCFVMAFRGTYYDVWRTFTSPAPAASAGHAPAGGGGGSKGPN